MEVTPRFDSSVQSEGGASRSKQAHETEELHHQGTDDDTDDEVSSKCTEDDELPSSLSTSVLSKDCPKKE